MVKSDKPPFTAAFAHGVALPPLADDDAPDIGSERWRTRWRTVLRDAVYGEVPKPPSALSLTRRPLPDPNAERLTLALSCRDRSFCVDAALWLPPGAGGPVPILCGLDFAGPAGILSSDAFPLDPGARIYSRPELGAPEGRLHDVLRGTAKDRWPIQMMLNDGFGVLVSCYGSWVPDDADHWRKHGAVPLTRPVRSGAVSLWAWALSRLVDAAIDLEECDGTVYLAGHSRLGKAALWATANDPRVAGVFANASGCGGAAPARHPIGETPEQMKERFPHWTVQGETASHASFDQHHLLGLVAPRPLYLGNADQDLWADPMGSLLALQEVSGMWGPSDPFPPPRDIWTRNVHFQRGGLGYHLRAGGHDMTPLDWRYFLDFIKNYRSQTGIGGP